MNCIKNKRAIGPTIFTIILLLFLALAPSASAGTNQWTTNGPYDGKIHTIAISPNFATDQTLFAGIEDIGVFRSSDGGQNWSAVNSGLPSTGYGARFVTSLALSPGFATDQTLYAGTSYGGVFRSTDGGQNWSAVNSGLTNMDANSLAISPDFATDQTIFAVTGTGVFRTTDGGQNWSAVNSGINGRGTLAISPDFATDQTLFANTRDNVYKSADGGSHWSAASYGLPRISCSPDEQHFCPDISSLAISPDFATDQTLFAGTGKGVFKSTDGGQSWSAANTNLFVLSLTISPGFATDHTIFAGTRESGVFMSTDGGQSWSAVNSGLTDTDTNSLAISPGFAIDHTIFAGTGRGVFKSTDGGQNWSAANSGTNNTYINQLAVSPGFAIDQTLFAATGTGVFESTDGGQSWSAVNSSIAGQFFAVAFSPGFATDHTLFAGGNDVYKSTDGGQSWSAVNSSIAGVFVNSLAVSPGFATDQTIFAGTLGGVYKSTDGGQSWSAANNGLTNKGVHTLAVSPGFATDQTIFAGTFAGIFKSTDGGQSWSAANNGLNDMDAYTLAVSPGFATDQTIFAGTVGGGFFKSTDGGQSWSARNNGLPSTGYGQQFVTSLAVSPGFATDHTLFASLYLSGVFESTDGGQSWSAANNGLTYEDVDSLAVSPNFATDQTIFAGTFGGGVFSFTFGPTVSNIKPSGLISTTSTTVSADYSDSGPGIDTASVAVYVDGNLLTGCTVTAVSVSCPVFSLSQGSHKITGSVSDNAGNSSRITGSFSVATSPYNWTWYDDVGGHNWIMLANPSSASSSLTYALFIAGAPKDLSGYNYDGMAAPGRTLTTEFPGLVDGPVTSALLTGSKGLASQRVLWPRGGSSLEEVPGTEESNLSSNYYWTWYDQKTPGMLDWVLVANPSAQNMYYEIFVEDIKVEDDTSTGPIAPGAKITPQFSGKMGGPVEVKTYSDPAHTQPLNSISSQRVLSNNGSAFNELPGTPVSGLSVDYLWTWYDSINSVGNDWIMLANPNNVAVSYTVKINGQQVGSGTLEPAGTQGDVAMPTFPGKMDGPVEVTATGGNIIASQRSLFGPSFEEVPGYSASSLSSDYYWCWYDHQSPKAKNWVLIANTTGNPVTYQIKIGGQAMPTSPSNPGTIPAGGMVTPTFPGIMNGPVEVSSSGKVMASQRVLWNGYFNEVLGTVLK